MTKVRKKVDFTGQPIYVGTDVHKKSWTVAVCTENVSYRPFRQAADGALLPEHLHGNFPDGENHSAYEAGFSGFWLHRLLVDNGVDSMVTHPGNIPTAQ